MPDNSGAVDLDSLSAEDREAVERLAEQTEPGPEEQKRQVLTGFFVALLESGDVVIVDDVPPNVERTLPLTDDLIYALASTVLKDVTAAETAKATLQAQMQQARAVAQQMQEQQLREQLKI